MDVALHLGTCPLGIVLGAKQHLAGTAGSWVQPAVLEKQAELPQPRCMNRATPWQGLHCIS